MALTAAAAAVGMRLVTAETDYTGSVYEATLPRLLRVATAIVDAYAPDAPDDVKDEAILRFMGWVFDAGAFDAGELGGRPAINSAGAVLKSGAASLLKPWRVPRAGACDA